MGDQMFAKRSNMLRIHTKASGRGFVPATELPDTWFPIAAARGDDGRAYALAHADDPRLARVAVFDAVVNNADRKGGHLVCGPDQRVYGVDHGVCFHVDEKLRTVLWGWARQPLPGEEVERLRRLASLLDGELGEQLAAHLTVAEVRQLGVRIERLLATGVFPKPSPTWPAVPWPPI